jgi:outer membrane receptor protein involved in Fe transport
VTIQAKGYRQAAITSSAGEFFLENVPREDATLIVEATGFQHFERPLKDDEIRLDIELHPASVVQEVNVTANRTVVSLSNTAESITVLSREDLQTAAAQTIDGALRAVPGFTLFRRSSSTVANPTSQGVSLRGIGASGASRALVLYNSVPLNDPFGGWVYWGRVPRESVGAIEVLRGGASSLYGSGALGGVVNILPLESGHNLFSSEVSMGSEVTPEFSAVHSWKNGKWILDTTGEVFRTDGFILVPPEQRGAIDVPADSVHQDIHSTVHRQFGDGSVFVAGSFYNESRDNGTVLQTNDTQLWEVSGGTDFLTRAGNLQLRGYGDGQSFNQTFSSIALNRNSESLVNVQHVPAQRLGGSLLWSRELGSHSTLVAGGDSNLVRGFSNELTVAATRPTSRVSSGGHQLTSGAFAQDVVRLSSRILVTLGLRYDNWNNYDAQSRTLPLVSTIRPNFTAFADQSRHAFSPRVALLLNAGRHITFTASGYKSFRAPTLNELYRGFRLGNTITLANSQLSAERLTGGEAGANLYFGRTRVHTAFFWMQVSDPIANVTLTTTPALITNQRQNLGRTRSRGIEADLQWNLRKLDLTVGYQFADATVISFSANPKLVGLQIPQTAPHQFTLQGRYRLPAGWVVAVQARALSSQFEDDLNQLPLDSYFQLDGYASKRLHKGVEAFVGVENIFNSRAMVGRTPVTTLGPPILARAGFKFNFE